MGARIIVVDEDPAFVSQVEAALTKAGHRVTACVGRDEAVRTFSALTRPPDLAIIDFVVPGITGPELIGAVKRRMPTTKVIATVPPYGRDLSDLVASTGADLIARRPKPGEPVDREEWIRVVARVLGSGNRSAA